MTNYRPSKSQEIWNEVRDYYYERFGIAPELVDIAPVLDILRLCASGSSNKSIANFLGEPEQAIMEIIDAYLGFMGWKVDLEFSPLKYYKEWSKPDVEKFQENLVLRLGHLLNMDIVHMYNASAIVDKLERLFDEKWI